MTSLKQSLSELDQQVADQLLATAVEIASQILRQSLRVKPELLLPVVREAMATLHPHLGHPALFVHPDDAALIRTHLGDQLTQNNWRIIEDGTLSCGGCRVELGASDVDATLETRWRRVIESIGISQEWLSDKP
jgi:flagellar assembly protein FliH